MKSKVFLLVLFLFSSLAFLNAQANQKDSDEAPSSSLIRNEVNVDDQNNPTTPSGKVTTQKTQESLSNDKTSATSNKTAVPAQRKKVAKIKATKVGSSK